MDLRQLQTLVVLAEESHFGRAARRLHVVQSAVTRTIQSLEDVVNTRLVERDKRRVILTPAGEKLVERARVILAATDRAAREAREVGEGKLGTLCIAISGISGIGCLPEAMRQFQNTHPTIAIELCRMSSAAQILALTEGEIDLALSHIPFPDERIHLEHLQSQRLFAILPENHHAASGLCVPWSCIEGETHIVLSRSVEPEVFRTFVDVARGQGELRPKIIEVEDISLMLTLVAAGLGISHLPEDAIRLEFRGVIALPIEPTVTVTLYAARSADRHSALVDDFLAILGTS